jgi:hypothetical protein
MKRAGRKERAGKGADISDAVLKDLVQDAYAEVTFTREDAVRSALAETSTGQTQVIRPNRRPVRIPVWAFGLTAAAVVGCLYAVLLVGTPSKPYVQVSRERVIIVGEQPFAAVQLERGTDTLKETNRRAQ